jgi:nitrite reductase/ring-hydroxylating ferredoxin subunit
MTGTGWQLLGMAEDAPGDGDFFTSMLGATPVFVQRHGSLLLCFANACTHRGFPLRNMDFGTGPIRCPLHQWVFAHDGRLTEVRGCTPEDLATFDSDLVPLDMMQVGPALFGRWAESCVPVEMSVELEACTTLLERFERPATAAETGQALGAQAWIEHLVRGGRSYRVIRRQIAAKQRCWIFSAEATLHESDYAAADGLYDETIKISQEGTAP